MLKFALKYYIKTTRDWGIGAIYCTVNAKSEGINLLFWKYIFANMNIIPLDRYILLHMNYILSRILKFSNKLGERNMSQRDIISVHNRTVSKCKYDCAR